MANYVLEGPRWGSGPMGTAGGTVGWVLDATVPASFAGVIRAAFADWTSQANIAFKQLSNPYGAQITLAGSYIDGPGKVLGTAEYSYTGSSMASATVTFDTGDGWHHAGGGVFSSGGIDLYPVAVHEIGHALGLGHYNDGPAIMNSTLNNAVTDLTASDIAGIQALYGPPAGSAVTVSMPALFGSLQYSASGTGGVVYGLYKGLLGRAPDPLGLEAAAAALAGGGAPAALAGGILGSAEYANRNGGAPSDAAFVSSLYLNALNRAPDAQGQAYFLGELGAGVSRAAVATQIATSGEAQAVLSPTFSAGIAVTDAASAQVARLYYGVLGRAPDSAGLAALQPVAKAAGAASVAQAMLSSQEYATHFGALSDGAFIDSLYVGALSRHADSAALTYWGGQLATAGRAQVAVQISQSTEAQVHLVGVIEQGAQVFA
jgi:hypothetical protein